MVASRDQVNTAAYELVANFVEICSWVGYAKNVAGRLKITQVDVEGADLDEDGALRPGRGSTAKASYILFSNIPLPLKSMARLGNHSCALRELVDSPQVICELPVENEDCSANRAAHGAFQAYVVDTFVHPRSSF